MRTVKAITGMSAAERFYMKLSGAIRYMLPAATALAFLGLTTDAKAQTPSTDIQLTNLTINENEAIGTAVGFLSADDVDLENHTFTLVPGAGDDDNASFDILANKLQSNEEFNFEVKSTYSVRISALGDDGLAFEKDFIITIDDVNDIPVVEGSVLSVEEGQTLSLTYADFENHYTDEDGNALQLIEITSLPSDGVLNYLGSPVNVGDLIPSFNLDLVSYDADAATIGVVSFDWMAYDGANFSADATMLIKVRAPRSSGPYTGDVAVDGLPGGFTVVGHPGTRPVTVGLSDVETGGGYIPGATRRGVTTTGDVASSKIGDETTGVGSVENFDLNINAFPNPFASNAEIRFTLPESAEVEVNVYNYMGALVKQLVSGVQPAGINTVQFGDDLGNGSYIYTVKVVAEDGQATLYRTGSMIKIK